MEQALAAPERTIDTRVSRLREKIINAPQEVCVERARFLTRSMKQHWDKDPLTRMSLALEHVLGHISVIIREDEWIVGCRTSKLKGAPLFPEQETPVQRTGLKFVFVDDLGYGDMRLVYTNLSGAF